jgi:hypothetical protein
MEVIRTNTSLSVRIPCLFSSFLINAINGAGGGVGEDRTNKLL